MAEVMRVPAQDARRQATEGALLVCAYDDEAKCRSMMLDGAITMAALQGQLGSLPQDKEIILYCG